MRLLSPDVLKSPPFKADAAGHMVIPAAVLLLGIAAIIGGIYDLRALQVQTQRLQAAANAAALEGARGIPFPDNNVSRLEFSARALVVSLMDDDTIDATATLDRATNTLDLTVEAPARVRFPGPLSLIETVSASSSATLLDPDHRDCIRAVPDPATGAAGTIPVKSGARVMAPACRIHADGKSARAIRLARTATVEAGSLQHAIGGRATATAAQRQAIRRVAATGDPLAALADMAALAQPAFGNGSCDHEAVTVTGRRMLVPGTYCGGLTIDGGTADLSPGTFILKDGPLRIINGGAINGTSVGLLLVGEAATMAVAPGSAVALTAPQDGPMAGVLVRGSRVADATFGRRDHTLSVAGQMAGTIYLPGDRLVLTGPSAPMATQPPEQAPQLAPEQPAATVVSQTAASQAITDGGLAVQIVAGDVVVEAGTHIALAGIGAQLGTFGTDRLAEPGLIPARSGAESAEAPGTVFPGTRVEPIPALITPAGA